MTNAEALTKILSLLQHAERTPHDSQTIATLVEAMRILAERVLG